MFLVDLTSTIIKGCILILVVSSRLKIINQWVYVNPAILDVSIVDLTSILIKQVL